MSYESYQMEVERAEKAPACEKRYSREQWFGIPMEGYTYYFTYEEDHPTSSAQLLADAMRHGRRPFPGRRLLRVHVPLSPFREREYGIKTRCYISSDTMNKLTPATRLKYDEFLQEGSLMVLDCVRSRHERGLR